MKWIVGFLLILAGCSSLETPEFRGPEGSNFSHPQHSKGVTGSIQLDWPVRPPATINQRFKTGSKRTRHQGLDIAGPKGTPILAAHEGTIIYTGRGFHGFGKMVMLEHPDGYATFYAHLNSISAKEGQWVHIGQKIGAMGRTGRATGVHLHFELRVARIPVDPLPYLPQDRYPANFRN